MGEKGSGYEVLIEEPEQQDCFQSTFEDSTPFLRYAGWIWGQIPKTHLVEPSLHQFDNESPV